MEEARDANPVRLNVGLGFDATNDLVEELERRSPSGTSTQPSNATMNTTMDNTLARIKQLAEELQSTKAKPQHTK